MLDNLFTVTYRHNKYTFRPSLFQKYFVGLGMSKLSKTSLSKLYGVHPDLICVIRTAIIDTPYDFSITDGVRTTTQQQALYAKGRTTSGEIVTNADGIKNKSNHQAKADGFGYAIDIYPYIGHIDYDDTRNYMPAIATHIKDVATKLGIAIAWGGDWKCSLVDKPHFELKT